jgi:hypothetical protein
MPHSSDSYVARTLLKKEKQISSFEAIVTYRGCKGGEVYDVFGMILQTQ